MQIVDTSNNTLDENLSLKIVLGELRILDTDLARRLGFSNPIDIRKTVRRHLNNLSQMGVIATVEKTPSDKGGRPAEAYYLNKKQAIFITAKSETKIATEVTIEIIERFDAYERGEMPHPQIPRTLPEALRLAADQAEQIASLEPKALAFDSLINNGELPSLRTFFKQFHELNLTAIPETLGKLGYLQRTAVYVQRTANYVGPWEVRRSHPRAAELFRQRIKDGIRWQQITVLLTPQGQEEMARLYRQGAFPKLVRFSH